MAAVLSSAALLLAGGSARAAQTPQIPIAGSSLPQFVDPLPLLSVQPGGTMNTLVTTATTLASPQQLTMCEFPSKVLPSTWVPPLGSTYAGYTWTWGYIPGTKASCPTAAAPADTYIGPVLVNLRGVPTAIKYTNDLPFVKDTNVLAYKFSTDQTLHWADPLGATPPGMTSMGPEGNMCAMASGDPPQMGFGIPAPSTQCALNFGEDPTAPGSFLPVGIPAVPHLHGGEVPPVLDGGPDAWFTSDGIVKGHDFHTYSNAQLGIVPAANEAIYRYPNTQAAAPLWFHDHTLGATRLNVYAGIAGAYYLLDPAHEAYLGPPSVANPTAINLPPVTDVVPLVIQDRMFDTNGQLYFPNDTSGGILSALNPQHPYWVPEFIGDTIVVNGKAWPFFRAQTKRYRFLVLNGSNARTYELFFVNQDTQVNGPPIWVIGNDGGLLDFPQKLDPNLGQRLVIMPGERYEVIVDFGGTDVNGVPYLNQNLILKNVAKAPYPAGAPPRGRTTGRILKVRVRCPDAGCAPDTTYDPASGISLRPPSLQLVRLAAGAAVAPGVTVSKTRALTLNEVMLMPQIATDPVTGLANTAYPGGPVEILVNNSKWAGTNRPDFQQVTLGGITEFISETPTEGTTEIWEIVNTTADAHPIHTHLTTFQIISRQNFDSAKYLAAYGLLFPASPGCLAGAYCPGFGPPLSYDELSLRTGFKLGGNPDVALYLQGPLRPPDPSEIGWKDTVMAPPGMVTRFVVRFAPTDFAATAPAASLGYPFSPNDGTNGSVADSHAYVWHCHIIDHEDNEMMRQHSVIPNAGVVRTFVKGADY